MVAAVDGGKEFNAMGGFADTPHFAYFMGMIFKYLLHTSFKILRDPGTYF